jgi:hypothetical protein
MLIEGFRVVRIGKNEKWLHLHVAHLLDQAGRDAHTRSWRAGTLRSGRAAPHPTSGLLEWARRREHRRPLVQAATRISLACLQAVAHRNAGGVARMDVFEC